MHRFDHVVYALLYILSLVSRKYMKKELVLLLYCDFLLYLLIKQWLPTYGYFHIIVNPSRCNISIVKVRKM